LGLKERIVFPCGINSRVLVNRTAGLPPQAVLFVFVFLPVLLLFSSCPGRASPPASPAGEIRRIISTAPSNTEIIADLGLGAMLIATDKYSRNIAGVPVNLPEVDFFFPDAEAIIGLEPDIIFAGEINAYGAAADPFKLIREAGIQVISVPTSMSIEGIYRDILLISETLELKEKGEELIETMRREIAVIAGAASAIKVKKTVYLEIDPFPFMVSVGGGTYLNEMLEISGARNIFAREKGWFSAGAEAIIQGNPDVILTTVQGAASAEDAIREIKNRPGFETISAVRNNRVYSIDADSASRPSARILKALGQMAAAVGVNEAD
jgi:iron complex transport system substrate-binding protein